MARMHCASSGRPGSDIGIAPRPMGNTSVSARRRVFVWVVVMLIASPRPRADKRSGASRARVNWSKLTGFTPTVDPYRDTTVIDARGPRTNQAVIGTLSAVALLTGAWWIAAVLALQLALGLTLGRRWCLPCVAYFEL